MLSTSGTGRSGSEPRPNWSLPLYLAIGFLLRLPAVAFADGYEFVDQQFQYIDPAWHLATGASWHRTWEWIDGIRSWVYPGLLSVVFRALAACGLEDPMWTMRGVRLIHAVSGLLPLWLFWNVVTRWRASPAPRDALLLFAGSGLCVAASVQPSGPTFAASLATAAALAVHGPRWFPALGGLCLGLAFCCRPQEAIYGPALLGVLLWQRRFAAAAQFASCCVPGILLQGCVDLAVQGRFLGSVFGYVRTNVGGAAEKWREQEWWFYLVAGVVPVLALVPPFLRTASAHLWNGARLLPGAAVGAALHIVVYSFVSRKALRFEQSALILSLAVLAVGMASGSRSVAGSMVAWHRRVVVAVHTLLFVYASFWFGNAGAIRTACDLRDRAANRGEIVVVDGDATSMGGFFYLRPETDRVVRVARIDIAARLAARPLGPGDVVVAVRTPLDTGSAPLDSLELIASFPGSLDLRAGERRFVYRRRARRITCRRTSGLPSRRPSVPRPSSASPPRPWSAWSSWCS